MEKNNTITIPINLISRFRENKISKWKFNTRYVWIMVSDPDAKEISN